MNATEFAKAKMHFTIGLLATLFALHPFFPQFDKLSFVYMGVTIPLSEALMAVGVCLAIAVYFYASDLMTEHPSAISQRLGNWFYSMAIMMVPFYIGLYLTTLLENYLILNEMLNFNLKTPAITIGILVVWVFVWQTGTLVLRRYLSKKDWTSRIEQLTDREMDALKRGKELLEADHTDLAVIQFYKAVMARLKMATMKRGYFDNSKVIANARACGIVNESNQDYLSSICFQYGVASSTTPVEHGQAALVALATKKFLSTIAV